MMQLPKALKAFPKTDFRKAGRAISDFGGEGTLDFAAEGRRGRGSREFVLIRAARGIRGSILPESLTTDHTNLHGCPRLVSFRQGKRAMGLCGDEGTLDFAAEGQRGRGSREFVLISAILVERGNGRRFAPQRWERRRDFSGRGIGDFVLISAASAPLPLCGNPDVHGRSLLGVGFAHRFSVNKGNVRELARMSLN
jgi:hypothetical protein